MVGWKFGIVIVRQGWAGTRERMKVGSGSGRFDRIIE